MNNTLTEGDRALVREMAREVAETMARQIAAQVRQMIRLHQAECPGANMPMRFKMIAIGVGLGSGLLSAGGVFGLLRIFGG